MLVWFCVEQLKSVTTGRNVDFYVVSVIFSLVILYYEWIHFPATKISFHSTFKNRRVYIQYFAVRTVPRGAYTLYYSKITLCYLKFTELYNKQYEHLTAACKLCLTLWGAP